MAVNKIPMTEHEYEDWFERYLSNIESLDKTDFKSPLLNIPKMFNNKKWIVFHVLILISSVILSFILAYINSLYGEWLYAWFSNAFLNLSLGLVASLIVLIYTNHRDRNIAFYSDIIPLLKTRYDNLSKAYFDFRLKIVRYHQKRDYENCYAAWYANANTCIVIIDFFKYLLTVIPFRPKSVDIDLSFLEKSSNSILEANNRIQNDFFKQGFISDETIKMCNNASDVGGKLLENLEELIIEFEQMLYGIKYTKKHITKEEKSEKEYERQVDKENRT